MTTHTITTTWNEIEVEIAYDYSPGEPNGYSTEIGSFVWPPEVEFLSAKVGKDSLDRWAERWLHGVGHDLAVAKASRDLANK